MTSEVIIKIHECIKHNIGKLIFSLLVISILTSFLVTFSMMPAMQLMLTAGTSFSISTIVMILISSLVVSAINYVLQYGYFVLVFLFYNNQYAVIAHLFVGFKDFKRAFVVGLIFTGIYFVVMLIFSLIAAIFIATGTIVLSASNINLVFTIVSIVSVIVLSVLYIFFGFTWFFLFENSRLTLKEAIKNSFEILKGKKASFIAFAIKTGGNFLFVGVLTFVITQSIVFIPNLLQDIPFLSIVLSVLNVVYVVCLYVSIIRISFSFAAVYEMYCNSPLVIEEIDTRIMHLPSLHSDDQESTDDERINDSQ